MIFGIMGAMPDEVDQLTKLKITFRYIWPERTRRPFKIVKEVSYDFRYYGRNAR